MKKILGIVMGVGLSSAALAAVLNLDLNETVERAYRYDYTLKNSELDLENSSLKVRESYKNLLPSLDYSGRYTRYDETKTVNGNRVNQYHENSVVLSQPIFEGGALVAGVSSARYGRERQGYIYEDTKIGTMLSAIEKYINILLKEQELSVYEFSLRNMEQQYERANRKYDLDMIPKSEVLPFNTRILNLKTRVLESRNGLETAKADLRNYIGLKSNQDLKLKEIGENQYDISKIDLEADVRRVREFNRNVKIGNLDAKIKENDKIVARAEFLPKISAAATYRSGDEKLVNSADAFNWDAGINVKMNIFQFGQSIDRYQRSKNEEEKAKNNEEKVKNSVELNLRKSYLSLVKYAGVVEEQRAAVESARENYSMESRRYEMELTDAVNLVEIEKNLVESELSLISAKYNYFMAFEDYKALLQ